MCCSYPKVSHCDAAAELPEDYIANIQRVSEDIFKNDVLKYTVKEYKIELKPLFVAFELRPFAMTTLRSFLMFYLPLLEPATNTEEDDDDFPTRHSKRALCGFLMFCLLVLSMVAMNGMKTPRDKRKQCLD